MATMATKMSASASAGFVEYDFSGVTLDDGGTVDGFFIKNDTDRRIPEPGTWSLPAAAAPALVATRKRRQSGPIVRR